MTRETESRKNRIAGAIAAAVYVAVWLLLVLFISFNIAGREEELY